MAQYIKYAWETKQVLDTYQRMVGNMNLQEQINSLDRVRDALPRGDPRRRTYRAQIQALRAQMRGVGTMISQVTGAVDVVADIFAPDVVRAGDVSVAAAVGSGKMAPPAAGMGWRPVSWKAGRGKYRRTIKIWVKKLTDMTSQEAMSYWFGWHAKGSEANKAINAAYRRGFNNGARAQSRKEAQVEAGVTAPVTYVSRRGR